MYKVHKEMIFQRLKDTYINITCIDCKYFVINKYEKKVIKYLQEDVAEVVYKVYTNNNNRKSTCKAKKNYVKKFKPMRLILGA